MNTMQGHVPQREKNEQLERAQRELNVLYEISCAMRTTLELDHILYIILTGVTSHTGLGYNRALLYLVNNKERALQCRMGIGPESGEHAERIWHYIEQSNQDLNDLIQSDRAMSESNQSSLFKSLKDLTFPLKSQEPPEPLLTTAFQKGTAWRLSPAALEQYKEDPFLKVFRTEELIIMPLKAKDTVNGLIVADNIFTKKSISEEEIKFFTMLANQAGLAIENSQLYEMMVHKSHTDPVTGLWNHGFFQEKLGETVQESRANDFPVSLAIIDLDNFKKLNDTYGHQHGDVILREVARLFKESSRDIDYVCRYGGEEFALILPYTSKQQSYEIAERLRNKVEQHRFPGTGADSTLNVTVSIGLSTIPDDTTSKQELFVQADKAMYIAKFSGKNKTCLTEKD